MKLLDTIKNTYKDVKDIVGDKVKPIPVIKATMMGPRGVGKTSVMASIFSDTKESVAGTKLYFRPSEVSSSELINKRMALMNMFEKRVNPTDAPQTGAISATNTVSSFGFEMGFAGRKKTVDIEIKDFPGEYLVSKPQEVSDFIAESHVVMIAIDTPYLMEDGGLYNEEKNDIKRVEGFLMQNADVLKNKMILLIPLKSERYFHDNRMEEVSNAVKSAYSNLIGFCKTCNVACAITPIQTLGGVEFDCFESNNALDSVSKLSKYRFYKTKPEYQPLFCVQPLYYLLTYIGCYYEWSTLQPQTIVDKLRNSIVSLLKDNDEFFIEIRDMSKNIVVGKFGYTVITKNEIFNLN